MRKLITLIVLIQGTGLHAQQPFEKYYHSILFATMPLIELPSGNLFAGMNGGTILDPQGNILHTLCYDTQPFTKWQSVRRLSDNEFYFVGGYLDDSCTVDATLEINPVIGKMDSLGSVIELHHYQLNAVTCSNTALDLEITSDGGAIAWGRYDSFYALRVDAEGAPLWSRQFDHRGSFGFIRELPSGDLLAGINMDTAGIVVARLDPNGNFLWCNSYIRPRGVANDCLIGSDGSFIVTGYTDSIMPGTIPSTDYHPKLFMMKLDGEGEVQWCKGYDSEHSWDVPNGSRITNTQDGNYAVLGNIKTPNGRRPYLMKTDLNGDTLWTRSAGVSGYTHGVVDLLAASDGGFYYGGIASGNFGLALGAAYLFKTDPLGHLPCSEKWYPVEVVDLFPTDSSFTLTSIDGAVGFSSSNTEYLCGPSETYDGCLFTSVPQRPSTEKFRIRPNPNAGQFTVEFPEPLAAESYYSVYDTMGRLLYQRPLPTGATLEEIDLSRFGRGTYMIKFTDRDGVSHERVVLE